MKTVNVLYLMKPNNASMSGIFNYRKTAVYTVKGIIWEDDESLIGYVMEENS